jgi:hypothetical protein
MSFWNENTMTANWLNKENITKDSNMNVYKGPECKHTTEETFHKITILSTKIIKSMIQNKRQYVIQTVISHVAHVIGDTINT